MKILPTKILPKHIDSEIKGKKHNEFSVSRYKLRRRNSILQELKRQDQLHAQMAAMAKDEVSNYEPHEKATSIKFKNKG